MNNKTFFMCLFYLSMFLIVIGLPAAFFLPYMGVFLLFSVIHNMSKNESFSAKMSSLVIFFLAMSLPFVSAYAWMRLMGWQTAAIYLVISLIGNVLLAKNISKETKEKEKETAKFTDRLEMLPVETNGLTVDFEEKVKEKFGDKVVCKKVLYTPDGLNMILNSLEWRAEVRGENGKTMAWVGFDKMETDYLMVILRNE